MIGVPIAGYVLGKGAGIAAASFVLLLTSSVWVNILFLNRPPIDLKSFASSLARVLKTNAFLYSLIILLNIISLFRITMNTEVTSLTVLFIFFISIVTGWLTLKYFFKLAPTIAAICVSASIVNLFFLLNFSFSSNSTVETYSFIHERRWYHTRGQTLPPTLEKIAYIDLINDKYQEYHWFRMFFDFDSMKDKSEIAYTFQNGLFGLRVLKTYEFTK